MINRVHPENEVGIKWNNGKMEDWEERKNGMMGCWIPQYSNIPIFQYSRITTYYPEEP